jgi:hypothetical protein
LCQNGTSYTESVAYIELVAHHYSSKHVLSLVITINIKNPNRLGPGNACTILSLVITIKDPNRSIN